MDRSPVAVFNRLIRSDRPEHTPVLFDTACVLGGSVAGLLAARILSDHARKVLVVERDQVHVAGRPRAGVPHGHQVHGLLLGGLRQLERWLPGITWEAENLGGVLVAPEQIAVFIDGHRQAPAGSRKNVLASRPFLESRIRDRVLSLPNVEIVPGQATGLEYRDGGVSAVRLSLVGVEEMVDADFVVDAMGRASKLSDWLEQGGYERPPLERLRTGVGYSSVWFERKEKAADLELGLTAALFPPLSRADDLAVALAMAIEDEHWAVSLTTFGTARPPRTVEDFRSVCAGLPGLLPEVTRETVSRGLLAFHQPDSRRRHFVGLTRFPARVISLGDSVASLNATHAQGMSSAALQTSALSEYLTGAPEPDAVATEFFALQKVVVDALWSMGAGADTARLDTLNGNAVPKEVARQRWEAGQVMQASMADPVIAEACAAVADLFAHPLTLADPDLLERAIAVNRGGAAAG